ncbi:evolutionarily conserved C-terminal region 7 [Raphanus sativus]|uniref:YTH domain-containing family protein n=1 Tax=Raphanus sativus TaxID=3726 RepID=A0A6J0JE46_RAPSA|nr:YTH domain-containing protein ECT4 [Raphanus sativus]XP_018433304.2 YTH domain-containing protein ECT4 [Raphanus sativus]KAJ4917462.1 evolutionarily conserved C-terminal region 7 [Raphanus sativus]
MYTSEGAPDFVAEQGLYYPVDPNYAYYCTGYESPGEWENHQMFFGVDGSQLQYQGGQNENSPYIYYTPSYGFAQSPYNPFNPYIPGADSPFLPASQQYYPLPPYQNVASSPPAFVPYAAHPDIVSSSSANPSVETGSAANRGRSDGRGSRNRNASAADGMQRNAPAANSVNRSSEKPRPNPGGQNRPLATDKRVSTAFPTLQGKAISGSSQPADVVSSSRVSSSGQLDNAPPERNGLPSTAATNNNNPRPKLYGMHANISSDSVSQHNRGSRSKVPRNQLIVKAYTTKAGNADAEGNIVIDPNQYNKEDLRIDYSNAKFFVIKSYSEDDVHKSIKYSVWSSTLHGNKKLQSAYEDAQRTAAEKSCECPIFLFFSVNASGLFCGMAEMTGPVSFDKDMDFWQQDKWSGSFPVKWHIIKDVPNSYFRHIILQNNENKPVTNSRDTQEIMLKQGLEVLKIFKGHAERTSLLDDFAYYENRQRVMHDERNRLPYRSFLSPVPVPRPDFSERNKKSSMDAFKIPSVTSSSETKEVPLKSDGNEETNAKEGIKEDTTTLIEKKITSLTVSPTDDDSNPTTGSRLNQSPPKSKPAPSVSDKKTDPPEVVVDPLLSEDSDTVKVGSMPIKVTGSPPIVTVGTIPLDPSSLQKK